MFDRSSQGEAFARALSQDYAALLRSARQLSAYVREDILRQDPDAAMHALGMLDLRLAGMDRFVNDLIRYCRAGQRQVTPEQFSVSELAQIVFRKQNTHADARLVFNLAQDQIVADLSGMRFVFDELFRNAIVHHPEPEKLQIHVESSQAMGAGLLITVRDNGAGVPDSMLGKISQPFVKLSTGGKTPGLGLAIVGRELDAMGAELQFRAGPERGLTAVIVLPEHMTCALEDRRPTIEPLDQNVPPRLRIV